MRSSDLRIRDVSFHFEDFRYRTPIKFGGVALDRVTILNVELVGETASGQRASGFGSMPLGNVWAWPSRTLGYADTLAAMKDLAGQIAALFSKKPYAGHAIEIGLELEHDVRALVAGIASAEPMPLLAGFVVNSAFDAAIHDAYGKAHGLNCYRTYGPEFLPVDLGKLIDSEFAGLKLDAFVRETPQANMPLYHLVGALDPLSTAEIQQPVGDGLPETLGEWIVRDGLTHMKIKLNGDDLNWDVARVLGVNRIAEEKQRQRDVSTWFYSLDFNERCQNVAYLIEFLRQVEAQSPAAYARVQYIEQPTARDLKANPANQMHEAAKLRPIVIDESLLDLETLRLAREMGYTGVAFKACKGQTQSLLMAAAAQHYGMFRCVQDLTCVGASLIHSAGLAAHIPGVAAIESNGRQYCPIANEPWEARFPGVFRTTNGNMNTAILNGPGLGATH